MPRVNPTTWPPEKEERCLYLWLVANRDHPDWSIEKVHGDILCKEFAGHAHKYKPSGGKPWPKNQWRSSSWLTQRIANQWKGQKLPDQTEDPVVKPWDEKWGNDPVRVRVLSILFDLASNICQRRGLTEAGFEGFPNRVCNWACKLSGFFDLQLKCECLVLLHFAYVFAADDQYSNTFGPPMTFQDESSKMLMRWHKRHQEPDLTEKLREREGVVVIPLWEQDDWSVAEDVVARHLLPMAWVLPPLNMGEVSMETVNREYETIYQANLGPEEND